MGYDRIGHMMALSACGGAEDIREADSSISEPEKAYKKTTIPNHTAKLVADS